MSVHGTTTDPRFREWIVARCAAEFGRAPDVRIDFEGHDAAFVFAPDLTKQEAQQLGVMLEEGMSDDTLTRFTDAQYAVAKADLVAVREYRTKANPTAVETTEAVRRLTALVEALLGFPPPDLRERAAGNGNGRG